MAGEIAESTSATGEAAVLTARADGWHARSGGAWSALTEPLGVAVMTERAWVTLSS